MKKKIKSFQFRNLDPPCMTKLSSNQQGSSYRAQMNLKRNKQNQTSSQ